MELVDQACERFNRKNATVGVIGLGYAGLPLACCYAEAGFRVIGFDIDPQKVDSIRRGSSYIKHIGSERIRPIAETGTLTATTEFALLAQCDACIVCVPTPLAEGRMPDLTFILNTTKEIATYLRRGQLVVLESTTYPGTTDEVMLPILGEAGLQVGTDYFLAFSPEREDPANTEFNTRTIPKIVGGVTPNCLRVAVSAYGQVVKQVVPVSSARVAEAAKLLENIYRCVNIAMINELKMLFERMSIDTWEVIKAASTKPFGFTPFYPGPGLGGHCIPIDPFYLSWKARQYDFQTRFIELAGEINTMLPAHVVDRIADGLNLQGKALKEANILLIGVAYKRDVDDVRESPALAIIKLLQSKLARVSYHDPFVPRLRSRHLHGEMSSVELTPETIQAVDAVVITTNHSGIDYERLARDAQLVVDTRNVVSRLSEAQGNVIRA